VRKLIFTFMIILLCATMMTSCDFITRLFSKNGTVTGYVYSASTNDGVGGVLVEADGTTKTATTDSDGCFAIELPEGSRTLRFTKTGYTFYDVIVMVVADDTVDLSEDIVGYTPLASGGIRIVLTWGEDPGDLDSHLLVPGTPDEIYYDDQTASDSTANLDWDETDGYGLETTTISTQKSGTYYYSVYNYDGSGSFVTTGAVVKVYNSAGLWKTYDATAATGDGTSDWWRVFSLDGTTITSIGTFDDTAGTGWPGIEY